MQSPQRSKEETRLIMIRILILAFVLFFNSITTAYLDTFLPDMMILFKVTSSKSEAGKSASGIFTAFFIGRFISASFWGIFIDKYGRKHSLVLVLLLLTVCTFLFGLSSNLYYALFIRFLTGMCNGLSIIGKTLSTEICPNDMKPWSISVTNTIWSLGMTVGPIIGSTMFNKIPAFPILASSLAVCLIGLVLAGLSMYYMEETLQTAQNLDVTPKPSYELVRSATLEDGNDLKIESSPSPSPTLDIVDLKLPKIDVSGVKPKSVFGMDILAVPNVMRVIIIFSSNTFFASVLVGLIPFWTASKFEDGGLDFKYHDISDIFIYLTLPQLVLQIFLYPMIQKLRGDYWLITFGHYAHIPMFFLLPFAHFFGKDAMISQKIWITFWMFIRNLASFINFAVLQRYGNDIISAQRRGKMNGIQITCSSLFQIFGTILGGWMLSWSETNQLSYPFNYHFVFLVLCAITAILTRIIIGLKFLDREKTKLMGEETMVTDPSTDIELS